MAPEQVLDFFDSGICPIYCPPAFRTGTSQGRYAKISLRLMHFDKSYATLMADYNRVLNENLYAVCATMPSDRLRQDCGVYFGSIFGVLNHLLFGDYAWMGRLTGETYTTKDFGEEIGSSLEELLALRREMDARIVEWASELNDDWLLTPFEYTSGRDGITRTLPAWVLVAHMFNHQTHHRGQITALLSQMGYESPETDLPRYK